MLRFLTAGESHGQTLVMTLDGMPAGLETRHRRPERPAPSPPGRLRSRPADADRKRPRRDHRRRSPWAHDGRANRPAHSQPRLGQLATDDVRGARDAGRRDGRQPAATSHGRGRGTPISPARSSTAIPTCAMCSSAQARVKQQHAWPQVRSRDSCSGGSASGSRATYPPSAGSRCRRRGRCHSRKHRRSQTTHLSAAWTRASSRRMIAAIDAAKEAGDTLGGAFEVIAKGLPPGLGLLRAVGSQSSMAASRRR